METLILLAVALIAALATLVGLVALDRQNRRLLRENDALRWSLDQERRSFLQGVMGDD